ncbi:hypothetical protein LEP1GSC071_3665 [Leptospira santarosai str. JET]|nr:hypothetical protein LEP1GSC071_3665 [Leptospira santarosai str. JET]
MNQFFFNENERKYNCFRLLVGLYFKIVSILVSGTSIK